MRYPGVAERLDVDGSFAGGLNMAAACVGGFRLMDSQNVSDDNFAPAGPILLVPMVDVLFNGCSRCSCRVM